MKYLLSACLIAQFSMALACIIPTGNEPSTILFQKDKAPKSFIIKTKKFKIKIDKQANGTYLYQSWGAQSPITAKPSLVIKNGTVEYETQGDRYYYNFKNKGYDYTVVKEFGGAKYMYTLMVSDKNKNTVLTEDGEIVNK
ncbi:hypothetical protein SAMN05880574_11767 [Chryseobacterium sp. RU37D]|nr:hypothetical protein SAMN05880574_11767 [Chryseobacterium sp. RU37D]